MSVNRLRENPRNARTHSDKQIAKLAASILQFGWSSPIVVDEGNTVLAGHGRWHAAKRLGLSEVPVIRRADLTPEQKRAFVIADNRLAELAGWDEGLLRLELGELSALDLSFDVQITGFDTVDLDRLLILGETAAAPDEADQIPPVDPEEPVVTQAGDVWVLGVHRLVCGNALDPIAYAKLLGRERAQMVFADAPYNVRINGNVTGKGKHRHREFKMASGEMSSAEFTTFLSHAMELMARHCVSGAINFHCMDWRHVPELVAAAMPVYGQALNACVWAKNTAGLGTTYRSQYEMVYVFRVGKGKHINNFGLGERGRYRTNVWHYPGFNSFGQEREQALAMHPTVKPVALVADAIVDCSHRKGIVLDPFGGSGTTLIAAERTGRHARLIELDPVYCDVIVRRWQEFTKQSAFREADRRAFDELAACASERASDPAPLAKGEPRRHGGAHNG